MAHSSVLDKYSESLENSTKCFSHGRNPFATWTNTKITHLALIMKPHEFFRLLIETDFVITKHVRCLTCDGQMELKETPSKTDGLRWKCSNRVPVGNSKYKTKPCSGTRSARYNTWFYNSKLTVSEILLFTYHWWFQTPMNYLRQEYHFSDHTLVDWSNYCREVAIDVVITNSEKIGGEGVIVEIDESKFGKSIFYRYFIKLYYFIFLRYFPGKYHRGKHVEGQWVFGGVERETGKCFLVPVEDRKANTLIDLIKEWILPGSIIISDCWKAYNTIK